MLASLPEEVLSLILSNLNLQGQLNLAAAGKDYRNLVFRYLKNQKQVELLRVKNRLELFAPQVNRTLNIIETNLLASETILNLQTSLKLAWDAIKPICFHIPSEHRNGFLSDISSLFASKNYLDHFTV